MNKSLLKRIKKRLYELENLISTPTINAYFIKNKVEINKLKETIKSYITNFKLLEVGIDESLLELLDEKLYFIISNKKRVSRCRSEIEESIHFIEKYKNTFFKNKQNNSQSNFLYIPPKQNISFLNKISIKNFFSIKSIRLINLKDKKEIYIVGENGDGKTLLLQAIAVGLKGTLEDGLKEFRVIKEDFDIKIENKKDIENNFFAYGSSRNNFCQLNEDITGYLSLFSREYDLKSPTKWLIDLYNAKNAKEKTIISLSNAIKLLQYLLNKDIEINVTYRNVTFTEKGSEVSFEQLSEGYKGVITIICDLIARLSEKQQVEKISDFQGVVLIDEVELHLHPKWQYSFIQKLRSTFPLIQFIVTTHSPTVLLGASIDAVYYHIYKDEGVVKISEQKEIKNDFLNDIQSSIFGFDVNDERINNPSEDDKKRQKRAKEAMLSLIDSIEKGE